MPSQHLAENRPSYNIEDVIRRRKSAFGEEWKGAELYGVRDDGNDPGPAVFRRLEGFEKIQPHIEDPGKSYTRIGRLERESEHEERSRGRLRSMFIVLFAASCWQMTPQNVARFLPSDRGQQI